MTYKPETVLVVLGVRMIAENPMPATITQWPKDRRGPKYQHLSPEQLSDMEGDQTALWTAEYVEGHYWLKERLPNPDGMPEIARKWRTEPVQFDESDIPF